MKPNIPEIVEKAKELKTTKDNQYMINDTEREELTLFIRGIQSIPEEEWQDWTDMNKLKYGFALKTAQHILYQSKIAS